MEIKTFWLIGSLLTTLYSGYSLFWERDIQTATFLMVCSIGLRVGQSES